MKVIDRRNDVLTVLGKICPFNIRDTYVCHCTEFSQDLHASFLIPHFVFVLIRVGEGLSINSCFMNCFYSRGNFMPVLLELKQTQRFD